MKLVNVKAGQLSVYGAYAKKYPLLQQGGNISARVWCKAALMVEVPQGITFPDIMAMGRIANGEIDETIIVL